MGFLKWFKSVLSFEKEHLSYIANLIAKDPERLLIGAIEPFSTGLWNTILGTDYEPIVGQLGQATEGAYVYAEERGVDTGPGRSMQGVATLIAGFYAGQYGMQQLTAPAAGAAGAAATPAAGGGAGIATTTVPATVSAAPVNVAGVYGPPVSLANAGVPGSVAAGSGSAAASTAAASTTTAGGVKGFLKGIGGFIKDNPEIVGSVISGVGQGLLADADASLLRERYANYAGTDPSQTYRSLAPGRKGEAITRPYGGFEYQYDPSVGRIVRVPLGGE